MVEERLRYCPATRTIYLRASSNSKRLTKREIHFVRGIVATCKYLSDKPPQIARLIRAALRPSPQIAHSPAKDNECLRLLPFPDGVDTASLATARRHRPITSCLLVATPSLAAANNALYSSDDGNFFVFGGLGLANIKAQEVVYDGDHKVSQLNWESMGMTLFTLGVGFMIT